MEDYFMNCITGRKDFDFLNDLRPRRFVSTTVHFRGNYNNPIYFSGNFYPVVTHRQNPPIEEF